MGKSHADCVLKAAHVSIFASNESEDHGFITSHGRFLNRKDASAVAIAANQIEASKIVLISEDLWNQDRGGKYRYDDIKGYLCITK